MWAWSFLWLERPAGEGDLAGVAPAGEVVVDELAAVVGVDPGEVEGEPEL